MAAPDPTGNFTPTSIIDIANALAAQVRGAGVTTSAEQCVVTALEPEDVPHLTGDFDILFRVGGEQPSVRMIDGAGRVVNLRLRDATLYLRSRVLLDVVGADDVALLDPSVGHFQLEDALCDALELFQPTDASGNWLCVEPVRLGRLGKTRRERQHPEWLISEWELTAPYVRKLSTRIT